MCIISYNLKLCTCKTKNIHQLKHYWIIKRRTEKANWFVGEMILPANIGEDAHQLNQKILLTQLNSGNCFDVVLQHQEGDTLELHFTVKANPTRYINLPFHDDYVAYAFKFWKGKWNKEKYDSFGQGFYEVQKGKIIKPFSKD